MVRSDNKIYDDYTVDFNLNHKSRKELRDAVVQEFLKEKGGYWDNDILHVTRYRYFVEKLSNGKRIYLKRPTYLNKGIDFQVWIEKMIGDEDKRPAHSDIIQDFKAKKYENTIEFKRLMVAVNRVWNCDEPDDILKIERFDFGSGLPVELTLKTLKWLFIEQDITYWNYQGRGMLKFAIDGLANSS
jgi:hypothetical protein